MMVVREGSEGVYQGHWQEILSAKGERRAEHWFSYSETAARRIRPGPLGPQPDPGKHEKKPDPGEDETK